jgi:hypothetical protein
MILLFLYRGLQITFYFCFILLFLIENTFNIGCLYELYQINGRNWIKSLQLYYQKKKKSLQLFMVR